MNFSTIRPRRVFVSGANRLSPNAALLMQGLGHLLGLQDSLIVLTGGLSEYRNFPGSPTGDRMIVEGMLAELTSRGENPVDHIETVLPEPKYDQPDLVRFREGRVIISAKRNSMVRRYGMMQSADAVLSIEGAWGTRSVLDVALAINRPILSLPFGGGASKDMWQEQREDILDWFHIDSETAKAFDDVDIGKLNDTQIQELAKMVCDFLLRGLVKGCFVAMRFDMSSDPVFDEAISPALTTCGFQPWRTDRSVATGDVVEAIRDGINHCYFVIADTSDDRPNVMYELGFAHATDKPVILLRRLMPNGTMPQVPFDFHTHSIIHYTDNMDDLRMRLEAAISMVSNKVRLR